MPFVYFYTRMAIMREYSALRHFSQVSKVVVEKNETAG